MSTVGSRLKRLREEKGLTQKEVAEQTGLVRATLANWELGRTEPDLDSIRILSTYYKVSTDWIIHGNKLSIPDDPKYDGYSGTLEEEFARRGLSPEAQRELLEAAIRVMEETKQRYKIK